MKVPFRRIEDLLGNRPRDPLAAPDRTGWAAGELPGRPGLEQFPDGVEGSRVGSEVAMGGIGVPGRHIFHARGLMSHAAVAFGGQLEDDAALLQFDTEDRAWRGAGDPAHDVEGHRFGADRIGGGHRALEKHCIRFVGTATYAGKRPPALASGECRCILRQEFENAGEALQNLDDAADADLRVEHRQLLHDGMGPEEQLDRLIGAGVRRAEQHDASAISLCELVPQVRASASELLDDEPAHPVGDDANGTGWLLEQLRNRPGERLGGGRG